jgi:hypothetical protein
MQLNVQLKLQPFSYDTVPFLRSIIWPHMEVKNPFWYLVVSLIN